MYTKPYPDCRDLPFDEIVLFYNELTSIFWLELSCTDLVAHNGEADHGATYHVGAIEFPRGSGSWIPVDSTIVGSNRVKKIVIKLTDPNKTHLFQRKIIDQWTSFNRSNSGEWAMKTSVGKSLTSASFVMKAIETGFVAAGERGPYESSTLWRVADFKLEDLIKYIGGCGSGPVEAQQTTRPPIWVAILLQEFNRIPARPHLGLSPEDPPIDRDPRAIPLLKSHRPPPVMTEPIWGDKYHYDEGKTRPKDPRYEYKDKVVWIEREGRFGDGARATDNTGAIIQQAPPYERVTGYGFRGDTRTPDLIRYAGGFLPNFTREDHKIESKKNPDFALLETEALDLFRYIKDPTYGGFSSAAKSYAIAKYFIREKSRAWIYACFVAGAFEITGRKTSWEPREQELAKPGMIDWEDIVACRECTAGSFTGPVYLRQNLKQQDNLAYHQIFELLNGKSQNAA